MSDQKLTLEILGIVPSNEGATWLDSIERGSTRPRSQLTGRNELLLKVQPGDTLVVAAPLCLGLSGADAEWFLRELHDRGVTVIVTGDLARLDPGADLSDMVRRVASAQNVHHVRVAKQRARKPRKEN